MGAEPAEPPYGARKWETLFIIYTHNGAASASRATKAGREGGYGAPAPWLRSSAVFNHFQSITAYSAVASMGSEIEGGETPSEEGRSIGATSEEQWSEEGRSIGATSEEVPSEEQRSEGTSSDGAPAKALVAKGLERWSSGVGSRSEGGLPALYRA